jgi:hypothetical protein
MSVPFEAAGFLTEGIRILTLPDSDLVDERGNPVGYVARDSVLGRVELGPETPGAGPIPSRAFVPPATSVAPGDRLEWDGLPGQTFEIRAVRPRQPPGGPVLFLSLEIA